MRVVARVAPAAAVGGRVVEASAACALASADVNVDRAAVEMLEFAEGESGVFAAEESAFVIEITAASAAAADDVCEEGEDELHDSPVAELLVQAWLSISAAADER
ncbi:hypothetical protein R1flu_018939 [Riccia fluitans]|uniref:Secreted protein n=1 Tax=Riccia fluitans TaxID=41844 RepID=A0ABD1ZJI2_9MARC